MKFFSYIFFTLQRYSKKVVSLHDNGETRDIHIYRKVRPLGGHGPGHRHGLGCTRKTDRALHLNIVDVNMDLDSYMDMNELFFSRFAPIMGYSDIIFSDIGFKRPMSDIIFDISTHLC